MRAAFVLIALFCASAVLAGSNEVDADAELTVPTLPGLGSGCLPKYSKRNYRDRNWARHPRKVESYGGMCVADNGQCPETRVEHGYCAGLAVVCCKNAPASASASASVSIPATPASVTPAPVTFPTVPAVTTVLKAAATACATQGGTCGKKTACTGTIKTGLCPGDSTIACCFKAATPAPSTPTPAVPASTSMTTLVRIPAGINAGLTIASATFQTSKLGKPGCPLTKACFSCNCALQNSFISKNVATVAVTPNVRITGLAPFVNAVKRALDNMKAAGATRPELLTAYNSLKTAGGLCCRPIKKSNGEPGGNWSNHSWGAAVDFYFGNTIDPRGDGKCQYGLSLMAPFFREQKLYWAAGYRGSEEDAMHFEVSQQALNEFMSQLKR